MLSKVEAGKKIGENSSDGKFLNDVETISKALYGDRNPSKNSVSTAVSRSKSDGKTILPNPKSKLKDGDEYVAQKEKKSFWNWKSLKALAHVRNRRFNCCFSLQVHSIQGLPSSFEDVSLRVHWKRRDGEVVTHPAKVFEGMAEFEEILTHTCSVYGSRSGSHQSAKYEARHFLLYASVFDAPEIDLGKHRIDLTRLLPLTLEELEDENSSGKWTTSFKLSGKAKGASLGVSFEYMVIKGNPSAIGDNKNNVPEVSNSKQNKMSKVKPLLKSGPSESWSAIRRVGSLPSAMNQQSLALSRSVENIKDLHEVFPISKSDLAASMDMLYQKFDEDRLDTSDDHKPEVDLSAEHVEPEKTNTQPLIESTKQHTENELSVIEQGVELSSNDEVKLEEVAVKGVDTSTTDGPDVEIHTGFRVVSEDGSNFHLQDEESGNHNDELAVGNCSSKQEDICTKESLMKELESALNSVSNLETAALDSPEDQETCMQIESNSETNMKGKSNSLDDFMESVASEFLDMLEIDHSPFGLSSESEPESPRELLLRQFEKETLGGSCSLFDFTMGDEEHATSGHDGQTESGWGLSEGFDLSSIIQASEEEHLSTPTVNSRTKAIVLEDLETEALMHEWGLSEKAFQCSPPKSSTGCGSPIDFPPEEPLELPALGEGLGSYLQTKNGGFVRSMNPALFVNAKSGGSLIMQVSSPVVVPAEMGSGITEILQGLAAVGIEKLSVQANKLMPLEDITGKTMQQVAWEAAPALEGPERQCLCQHESEVDHNSYVRCKNVKEKSSGLKFSEFTSSSVGPEMDSEFVSLEDLAPLGMNKIEALSLEGLRIQSGMSDEGTPSNITSQSIGEISALQGKGVNISGLGLEGTGGLQLLDIKDNGSDIDGLMGLSLTLDEWMRLDSGDIGDEDQISEQTSKILAAHHATSLDFIRGGSKGDKRRGKGSSRKCGLLGNNFTVALMVQLRDPLRNYEPVGAPMLSLIQVERVFIPPKPRIYKKVSEVRSSNEEDDESESVVKEETNETQEKKTSEEDGIPQYKITEVCVAGLKMETGNKKKLWGTASQQHSGSRWLVANGMGKSNKHPLMKSKAVAKSTGPATTKVQPGDSLWSISSRFRGNGAKW